MDRHDDRTDPHRTDEHLTDEHPTGGADGELVRLRSEVAALRAEVAAMRATTRAATGNRAVASQRADDVPSDAATGPVPRSRRTRREVIRRWGLAAGAAAVGAGAVLPQRAAADVLSGPGITPPPDPTDALIVGAVNETTQTTELKLPGFPDEPFIFSHVLTVNDGIWDTPRAPYTQLDTGDTKSAVAGFAGSVAMHGGFFQTNSRVPGAAGVRGVGIFGNSYGVVASGRRAALRLEQLALSDPPSLRVDDHLAGELYVDDASDLWYCVAAGTPGTWLKLAGPTTAGQFHPITPARVYDSRYTAAVDAGASPMAGGTSRLISVANAFAVDSPTLSIPDVVPPGSTAIAYNLSIVNTGPAGYLSVNPGGTPAITAASINWSAPGTVLGNASVVKLDGQRQLTVFCFGSSTDLIIDVVGYYR